MIKAIGAIIIIAACSVSSFKGVKRLGNRVKSMQSIVSALEIMKSEIVTRLTPVTDVFELLEKEGEYPANLLFKNASNEMKRLGQCSFFTIWRTAVEKTKELCLTDNEKLSLMEVGMCLGRYDAKGQEAMLTRAAQRFDVYRKRAEEDRKRDFKTQAYLGVISGVFVVIVLL